MLHVQRPEILRIGRLWPAALVLGLALDAAPAEAVTLDDLKGTTIQTRASYDMRIRRAEGDFTTHAVHVMKFKIDGEGRIIGDVTRTVTTPRGPRSRSHKMDARIGKPGDSPVGGERLWLIDGDKLVLLRAFDAGGFKAELEFKGSGPTMTCSLRAPFVREEGKTTRMKQGAVGGPVMILSATEKSANCRISR
jgi:hypothetical protein